MNGDLWASFLILNMFGQLLIIIFIYLIIQACEFSLHFLFHLLISFLGKSNSYYSYTELSQVIVSVGLITPKPDVFVEDVQHVLILATPVEIILLAVVFEENREISLIPSLF